MFEILNTLNTSKYFTGVMSKLCVLPDKYKYIKVDTNNDGTISDVEINQAIETLEKAKRQKDKERNINLANSFNNSM